MVPAEEAEQRPTVHHRPATLSAWPLERVCDRISRSITGKQPSDITPNSLSADDHENPGNQASAYDLENPGDQENRTTQEAVIQRETYLTQKSLTSRSG